MGDPFVLPHGPLMCRALPVSPRDSAAYSLEFAEPDSPMARSSKVTFDSTGSPFSLMMVVRENDTTSEAVVVRFAPTSTGVWMTLPRPQEVPTVTGDAAKIHLHADSVTVNLKSAELVKAKAVAVWFWNHRCGKSP